MGLVATWLNGIGLRSVVPTFEAAGIVSPAHLADLDVSYFESLGVTDPDDRRKLFYLVQRIKLAVNNTKDHSKMKSPTAEERVDAVISQNFVSEDERDTKSNSNKEAGHEFSEEKKVEAEPARRSKRVIAKKKKSSKASSKEDNDSDSDPSPSLLQKPGSMSRIKRAIDSKKKSKKNKDDTKKEKSSRSLAKKTGSSSEAQRKAKTKKEKVPKPPLSPTKARTSPSKPPMSPMKGTSASISPSSSPSERSSKKKDKSPSSKATKERGSLTRTNSSSSIQSLPRKKDKVKSPSKKDSKERKKLTRTNSSSSIQSLPVSPSKRSPTKKISSLQKIDFSGEIQRSPSKRQVESKLPAAETVGKFVATSSRTLSSDTSDSTATLGRDEIDEVRPTKSELPNSKSRRVTIAPGSDALGKTFQSSKKNQPKKEAVPLKEVKNKRGGSIPSLASSRQTKIMGVSESRLLQQYNQRRTSIARAPTATVAEQTQDQNVPCPSKKPVVTQGGSGTSESWGTKISHLREDNDAEHELFRDQVGDASEYHEYYDMRIKVVVRKRPMSKSEAFSGGIDIIHPLDFGSYGKTLVYQPKTRVDLTKEVETVPFAYDNVFDESSTNIGIYNRSLRNLVEPFFQGQWATVFAYGQTGSG